MTATCPSLQRYFQTSEPLRAAGAGHCDADIEDIWWGTPRGNVHLDLHRAQGTPRGAIVFQPGSGSYGRVYAPFGHAMAAAGYHVLAIDRYGHGWSDGERGDCSVDEALDLARRAVDHARRQWGLPVVLAGSSLGGLLVGFSLIEGLRPDYAVAHNFLLPGRLVSMRIRARVAARWRRQPYSVRELAHGFKGISSDPALLEYLHTQDDPQAAWTQSVRSVASLFSYNPPRPATATAPLALLTGDGDRIIPPWATRWFARWAGLKPQCQIIVAGGGHMVFHDQLAQTVVLVRGAIEASIDSRPRP